VDRAGAEKAEDCGRSSTTTVAQTKVTDMVDVMGVEGVVSNIRWRIW
jgi:hypothetical protein